MKRNSIWTFVCLWLAAVSAAAWAGEASAQLAKRGTYSGKFAYYDHNVTVIPIEQDRLLYTGTGQGAFLNDAGGGFLHLAVVSCPGRGLVDKGRLEFGGYCMATDKDGDKAVLKWSCTDGGGRCTGSFDWVLGTGKYAGIKGRSSFDAGPLGQAASGPVGYANWRGDWELP
jgi:hypothetical protein